MKDVRYKNELKQGALVIFGFISFWLLVVFKYNKLTSYYLLLVTLAVYGIHYLKQAFNIIGRFYKSVDLLIYKISGVLFNATGIFSLFLGIYLVTQSYPLVLSTKEGFLQIVIQWVLSVMSMTFIVKKLLVQIPLEYKLFNFIRKSPKKGIIQYILGTVSQTILYMPFSIFLALFLSSFGRHVDLSNPFFLIDAVFLIPPVMFLLGTFLELSSLFETRFKIVLRFSMHTLDWTALYFIFIFNLRYVIPQLSYNQGLGLPLILSISTIFLMFYIREYLLALAIKNYHTGKLMSGDN